MMLNFSCLSQKPFRRILNWFRRFFGQGALQGPLYDTWSTLLVMKCTEEVVLALFGSVPSLPRESHEGIPTTVRGVSRGGYPSQGPHCLPQVSQHGPLHSLWCTSWLKRVLCCGYWKEPSQAAHYFSSKCTTKEPYTARGAHHDQ